jgi:sulfonate transport system substrate-binding protein
MKIASKLVSTLALAVLAVATSVRAEDKPKVIRFGYPGVGAGGIPVPGGNWATYVATQGLFEQEFKKDGINVTWDYYLGAGPALNESYANDLLDVSFLGDLPSVVGRVTGLDYRIVLADARNVETVIAVPIDSRIKSIDELRGKRVGIFKGTNIQISADRILALHGLTEKDIKVVNLNSVAQQAALAARDIDAIFTSSAGALFWQDAGIGKIIYSSFKDPQALNYGTNGSVQISQRFIDKYPSYTQRIVNVLLKTAALSADPKNNDLFYKEWAKSGTAYATWKRDNVGKSLGRYLSPLLDDEFRGVYKEIAEDTHKYGLTRKTANIDEFIDDRFLKEGLKELHLENTWKAY